MHSLDKLKNAPTYATQAIENLFVAEDMLQDSLRHVPYCEQHKNTWSPRFASIIVDAVITTESLWKAVIVQDDPHLAIKKQISISDYKKIFAPLLCKQEAVFFGEPNGVAIGPFAEWSNWSDPKDISKLFWWEGYCGIKHDRFENYEKATLECAVHSLASLFLSIIYSGKCDVAIQMAQMLGRTEYNYHAYAGDSGLIRDVKGPAYVLIESKLFAHPLDVFGDGKHVFSRYWRGENFRFNTWWAINAEKYIPLP